MLLLMDRLRETPLPTARDSERQGNGRKKSGEKRHIKTVMIRQKHRHRQTHLHSERDRYQREILHY